MKTDSGLTQLNARIPKAAKHHLKSVAAITGIKMEMITADTFRVFFGIADAETKRRHRDCLEAFRRVTAGQEPSFN